ncbi:DEAD-box ATP-dependent RNA helicase 39 [Carica papaya]|uniref:DEAD-box ATP-dependent RNA helicase 39 n=1 Tax=Carica papaya TaxID=3649 RepID=UPI000B8CF5E4|nr:DEAD-box ATP-dependent RNA helicase 39 [Carica papaya]
MAMGVTSRTILFLSLSSLSKHHPCSPFFRLPKPTSTRVLRGFRPLCSVPAAMTTETPEAILEPDQMKHSILLERLRLRHLKDSAKTPQAKSLLQSPVAAAEESENKNKKKKRLAGSFEELGLGNEVMGAVREMNIEIPTEIQCIGIPAVLEGKSVVLGSHTGSGKTLAYMLPLVQLMRQDEALLGMLTKPWCPRAVVLCPTRELSEQVLEPSLAKGNRVMVFCNTLNSSRAVDHFLTENQISTVNYHGEVPAEQRVENLKKFKSDDGDYPTLVCTDLAARGLDLDVDHVIMFDFPLNSIDYLHRTGRTARMGAKGKVTSLVAKKDQMLALRIEEAIRKNESLESLTADNVRRDVARARIMQEKGKSVKLIKASSEKKKTAIVKPLTVHKKVVPSKSSGRKSSVVKSVKVSAPSKSSKRIVKVSKSAKSPAASNSKKATWGRRKEADGRKPSRASKLSVVGFRGRASSLRQT